MLTEVFISSLLICSSWSANLVEVLQKHKATTLVDLAVKAGLADTLTGKGTRNKRILRHMSLI